MGLTELIAIGVGIIVCMLWSIKNDKEDKEDTND